MMHLREEKGLNSVPEEYYGGMSLIPSFPIYEGEDHEAYVDSERKQVQRMFSLGEVLQFVLEQAEGGKIPQEQFFDTDGKKAEELFWLIIEKFVRFKAEEWEEQKMEEV